MIYLNYHRLEFQSSHDKNSSVIQDSIPVTCVPPACQPYGGWGGMCGGEGGGGHAWLGEGGMHGWGMHDLGRACAWLGGIHGWGCMEGVCMLESCMPPMDRMTDTCKNITFPQLRWWAVITIV